MTDFGIARVMAGDVDEVMPLLRGYCEFYEAAPSEAALQHSAVSEVNSDHQHTMQARARRGPTLSPNQPPGI